MEIFNLDSQKLEGEKMKHLVLMSSMLTVSWMGH